MSASPHLWTSITDALDTSEWFVLLMSPTAAQSDWVNKEVEYWLEHKEANRILPVLTDGSFKWRDNDFVSDAAPPALHGAFSEDPRWVDLRFARTEEQLDLKNPRFSAAVADIASAIRGIPKDELESEEVRQHRRTTRTAWAAASMLLILGVAALVAASIAVNRTVEAERQRDEANRQADLASARELIVQADSNLEIDAERSVLLALEGARLARSAGGEALQEIEEILGRSVEAMRTVATVPGSTVAASRSGEVMATVDGTGTVRLWRDGLDGAPTEAPGAAEIDPALGWGPVGLSLDGNAIAYASPATAPVVVKTTTGEEIAMLEGHTAPIGFLRLSADATRAVSGGGFAQTVRLWNLEDGTLIRGETADSNDGGFSPDGTLVAHGAYSAEEQIGSILIWDAVTGADVTTLCCHEGNVFGVAFGPDAGSLASTGFADGILRVWDVGSGEELWSRQDPSGQFSAVAFSHDGALIATGSRGGTVRLWDSATGEEVMTLSGHTSQVSSLSFGDRGELYTAAFDGDTRLWNIGPNRPGVIEFEAFPERPDDDAFISLAFSPEGDRLISVLGYDAAKLWKLSDLANPIELTPIRRYAVWMGGAFSPDGTEVAIGGIDAHPRLFDAETGELVLELDDEESPSHRGVAFSPDGSRLVSGSMTNDDFPNGVPKIWDAATGLEIMRLEHPSNTWEVAWSPDGTMIATTGQDTTRIWDAATGAERYALTGPTPGAVRFSPDSTLLATGGLGGISLWDAATGEQIWRLEGHAGGVAAVAFSPDGAQLLSGGFDTLAKIWDVATGVELKTVTEHPHAVTGVAWSSDETIATVSDLGDVRLHVRDLEALEAIARQRLTRSLTEAECRQYLHLDACPAS